MRHDAPHEAFSGPNSESLTLQKPSLPTLESLGIPADRSYAPLVRTFIDSLGTAEHQVSREIFTIIKTWTAIAEDTKKNMFFALIDHQPAHGSDKVQPAHDESSSHAADRSEPIIAA
jgi:hypothetical protein